MSSSRRHANLVSFILLVVGPLSSRLSNGSNGGESSGKHTSLGSFILTVLNLMPFQNGVERFDSLVADRNGQTFVSIIFVALLWLGAILVHLFFITDLFATCLRPPRPCWTSLAGPPSLSTSQPCWGPGCLQLRPGWTLSLRSRTSSLPEERRKLMVD
jgi:hypothetical protein